MLWSDPIGDMSLAQFLEHLAQHFWMPHVLDDQGQRLLQFLALLQHVGGGKEGSRLGKAGEEPFIRRPSQRPPRARPPPENCFRVTHPLRSLLASFNWCFQLPEELFDGPGIETLAELLENRERRFKPLASWFKLVSLA
jgi:hypothetical protein